MLQKLQHINSKLIEINIDDEVELKKYKLIEKILDDEKCFFKMSIEQAYAILRDLGFKEEDLKDIYMELIDSKNF